MFDVFVKCVVMYYFCKNGQTEEPLKREKRDIKSDVINVGSLRKNIYMLPNFGGGGGGGGVVGWCDGAG